MKHQQGFYNVYDLFSKKHMFSPLSLAFMCPTLFSNNKDFSWKKEMFYLIVSYYIRRKVASILTLLMLRKTIVGSMDVSR